MDRWFELSLGWGLAGAGSGAALGALICWSLAATWLYWLGVCLILALLCGAMTSFFGAQAFELIFDALTSFF